MTAHLLEWASLFTRWLHFAAGIAWIGASFYFIWVENALERSANQRSEELGGHLWAVHGGGFYYLEKYKSTPATMPANLHWFKWEAYTTWLSGVVLMILVYYVNADTWLLAPESGLQAWQGIALSVGTLCLALIFYLSLCATPLLASPRLLGTIGLALALIVTYLMRDVFAPRAAFLHLGAAIGTIMVANVLLVIIPGQKRLVASLGTGNKPNPELARRGALRSTHNNYLTLPVLLLMLSGHFPIIYTHQWWLAILATLIVGSVCLRHCLNLRNNRKPFKSWAIVGVAILLVAVFLSAPWQRLFSETSNKEIAFADVRIIMNKHCVSCHSTSPSDRVFKIAPLGFVVDNDELIQINATVIHQRVVTDRSMPFNNQTGMTDAERILIDRWYQQQKQ